MKCPTNSLAPTFVGLCWMLVCSSASVGFTVVMSLKIQSEQEKINLAGKQRMLVTQHEFGSYGNTEIILKNEIELGESTDLVRRYFNNSISYTDTLDILDKRVERRVSYTSDLSNWFVVVSSVIAFLDLSVFAVGVTFYALRSSTVSELTSVLKMLSHDFKGSVFNLMAGVEELEGQEKLKAELEHLIHTIQSMDHRVKIADGTCRLEASDEANVASMLSTLEHLFNFKLEICEEFSIKFKPDLLHVVMYQLLRNAHVHGGGKTSCTISTQDGFGVITFRNNPGENHSVLRAAGDNAKEVAMSGAVAKASSSSLGLRDIHQIVGAYSECSFTIKWHEDHVESELRVPIARMFPVQSALDQGLGEVVIRMCFVDDELGPRMGAKKVIKLVHPEYSAPEDAKKNRHIWEDDLIKVGATKASQIGECLDWVNADPSRTIVFLDMNLEFPGHVISGMDWIDKFRSQGALVIVRSGNDTDEDRARYIAAGAFGCVGKLLKGGAGEDVIESAVKAIRNNMQGVEHVALNVLPNVADGAGIKMDKS